MAYGYGQLIPKYLRYYLTASSGRGHGIHSPFVYDFVRTVLRGDEATTRPPGPANGRVIEELRRALRSDLSVVPTLDLGAGPGGSRGAGGRSVASIARNALKPAKFGQMFYRLVQHYRPATVIELGTSLGISTAYFALGNPASRVITLEGAPGVASVARENFTKLGLGRIELVEGNFDDTLAGVLRTISRVDVAFVDGNHRLEPTMRYYRQMQPYIHAGSILIFDDIHWSAEMEQAWGSLKADPRVRCSVDLFFIGLLFFREEFKTPQHFTIRF